MYIAYRFMNRTEQNLILNIIYVLCYICLSHPFLLWKIAAEILFLSDQRFEFAQSIKIKVFNRKTGFICCFTSMVNS